MPKGIENHIDVGFVSNIVTSDSQLIGDYLNWYSIIYVSVVQVSIYTYLLWQEISWIGLIAPVASFMVLKI